MSNYFHIGYIGFHPCIPLMLNAIPGGKTDTTHFTTLIDAELEIRKNSALVMGNISAYDPASKFNSLKQIKASNNESVPFCFGRSGEGGYRFTGKIKKIVNGGDNGKTVVSIEMADVKR